MDRDYPHWDMDARTRDILNRQTRAATYSPGPAPPAADIRAVEDYVGKDRLIASMAGTTDKSSPQWKNARDRLGRYRRGDRSPNAANRQALRRAIDAARKRRARSRRRSVNRSRRLTVSFTATFTTSRKPWTGPVDGDLTGPDRDDFLDAINAGDGELAAQIVLEAYSLDPEFVLSIDNPSDFTVNLGGPEGQ